MSENQEKKLPSREEVLKKFQELLNAKEFDKAAELFFSYVIAKTDPEEFARKLVEFAEKKARERKAGVSGRQNTQ